MKTEKEVVVPSYTKTETVKHTCDICGKEAQKPTGAWQGEEYFFEYHIEISCSKYYHDCWEHELSEITYYDICPDCFNNILSPFLESKGAKRYE